MVDSTNVDKAKKDQSFEFPRTQQTFVQAKHRAAAKMKAAAAAKGAPQPKTFVPDMATVRVFTTNDETDSITHPNDPAAKDKVRRVEMEQVEIDRHNKAVANANKAKHSPEALKEQQRRQELANERERAHRLKTTEATKQAIREDHARQAAEASSKKRKRTDNADDGEDDKVPGQSSSNDRMPKKARHESSSSGGSETDLSLAERRKRQRQRQVVLDSDDENEEEVVPASRHLRPDTKGTAEGVARAKDKESRGNKTTTRENKNQNSCNENMSTKRKRNDDDDDDDYEPESDKGSLSQKRRKLSTTRYDSDKENAADTTKATTSSQSRTRTATTGSQSAVLRSRSTNTGKTTAVSSKAAPKKKIPPQLTPEEKRARAERLEKLYPGIDKLQPRMGRLVRKYDVDPEVLETVLKISPYHVLDTTSNKIERADRRGLSRGEKSKLSRKENAAWKVLFDLEDKEKEAKEEARRLEKEKRKISLSS